MNRDLAVKLTRATLDANGLKDWRIRLIPDPNKPFLGMCSYKDKSIFLNAHHVDINPDLDVKNTIYHEVAHALCPGDAHGDLWRATARKLGCDNPVACSHLSLPAHVIDAIRSGDIVEVTYEEETHVVRHPVHKITRLQDKCETCGKIAKEKFSIKTVDKDGNSCVLITLECYHIIKKIIPKATPFENFTTFEHRSNGCKHVWDKNKCNSCGAFKLFPFQCDGARFIESTLSYNKGVALFDEMGLGKTVQPLAYLNYHPEKFPVLFVVKSGLKFQFFKEIIRWLGPSYLAQVISTGRDVILPGLKCYIIGYDLVRRFDTEELKKANIQTVILDECQQIKNPDSTRTQEIRKLVRDIPHVIPLSGTPWKNRGSEFFTVLNMIAPMKFPTYEGFLKRWVDYYFDGNNTKEGGIRNPEQFKEYIKDIAIRRERIDVMSELPTISRTLHYVELDDITQKEYDNEVSEFVKFYNQQVIGGDEDGFENQTNILARLARMRHITGLAKIPATIDMVEEFIEDTNRKIVIFVHHKDVGQIIFKELQNKKLGVPILQLDSSLNSEERFEIQEKFNKYNRCIMIGSTLASGEGLNLQTCSDCIMHERQWNPANEEQAEGRFIRIGQTANAVTATYITAAGTVDEHLAGLVDSKRAQFHATMNTKGSIPTWNERNLMKDLVSAIIKGARPISKAKKAAMMTPKRKVLI